MLESFHEHHIEVIALCAGSVHTHILLKVPTAEVRKFVGIAKKNATFILHCVDHEGLVWGKRCSVEPIKDRSHQVNSFNYICVHKDEGAWVWTFRESLYWRKSEA